MRTPERDLAFAYFENKALQPRLNGFTPRGTYRWIWFDPRTGVWRRPVSVRADAQGTIRAPSFPQGGNQAATDYAAKIIAMR
jgi:hypothetical protein